MSDQPGEAIATEAVVGALPTTLLAVEAVVDPNLSYVLSHNRRPPVSRVTVRNMAGGVDGPLTVVVSSAWTAAATPPVRRQEFVVECPPPGDTVQIDTSSTRLDDASMVELADAAPADVTVTVTAASGHTASVTNEVLVLARNQWKSDLFELTAAFVQPNHPAVAEILTDAASRLQAATGSSALDGYQSGDRARVVATAEAIFMALRSRVANYHGVPAGGEKGWGQLVRPLDQILEERQGNCIELACAFSSCLEQAGITPVIFFVHGHAFGGFFTEPAMEGEGENRWQHPLATARAAIANLMDRDGLVVPVETTMIPGDAAFADAVRATRGHIAERNVECPRCAYLLDAGAPLEADPHLEGALDVRQAHVSGVRPLPARMVRDGIVTIVIDNGPLEPPVTEKRDAVTHRLLPNTIPARVQQWKNSLLDLSRRNPLISFKAADRGLALVPPPGFLGEVEDFLVDGGEVLVPGAEEISPVLQKAGIESVQQLAQDDLKQQWRTSHALFAFTGRGTVEKRARDLVSKAKTEEQDTGVNNLHLALGSLTWPMGTGSGVDAVTSPIFLVPIRMKLKRGQRVPSITLDPGSMTTVNYCLLEGLRAKHGLKLQWFAEDMRDDSGLDILAGMERLRAELLESGLADRGFLVSDDASIGIFRFNKIRLWKDLDEHWEQFVTNSVVRHLVDGVQGAFADPADPEGLGVPAYDDTTLLNPQPADGAQTQAIVRAIAGQSFVLEGPPGTGKSQTITNLLANALAEGKKVLFVAEKQAALGVVKERLEAVGLHPYCLDLHDKGSKPEAIKVQLRDALDFMPSAQMDRWDRAQAAFEVAAAAMETYRTRLHGPTRSGKSYFEAHDELLSIGDGPIATVGRGVVDVDRADLDALRRLCLELTQYTGPAQPSRHHAWAFAGGRPFDAIDRAALSAAVTTVTDALANLPATGAWASALDACRTIADVRGAEAAVLLDHEGGLPSGAEWRDIARGGWRVNVDRAIDTMRSSLSSALALDPAFGPEVVGRDLTVQATQVEAAVSSFFVGRKGRLRGALGDLAGAQVFQGGEAGTTFAALAAASAAFRTASAELVSLPGMSARAAGGGVIDAAQLDAFSVRAERLSALAAVLTTGGPSAETLRSAMEGLEAPPQPGPVSGFAAGLQAVWGLVGASSAWAEYWLGRRPVVEAVRQASPTWRAACDGLAFVTLHRWIDLVDDLRPLEPEPFTAFRAELLSGAISGEDASQAFERAILRATLLVVGEEHQFDVFDPASHDRQVTRFVSQLKEREQLLRSVIPAMLHSSRSFDAASTVGSVGQLRTELNAKRRGARSVRDLLTKYPDLIVELTPCFLMSPDSVAKFLVPGKIRFDMVVFDEASQIRVAESIGAMGRASGVVVVGDSKQMPPTASFSSSAAPVSADELVDMDELAVVPDDEESILEECVESGMPRELLAWHYRSQDEILISFSNRAYYDGRLASFPSPFLTRPDCGLVYHRVNGQFQHSSKGARDATFQTNAIEADAIVEEVQRRVADPVLSQFSMGIVTLNAKQQELVRTKLVQLDNPAIAALVESEDPERELFVLNLESVQGRERDVIILGTSFSRRANGEKMPLNFGPLNQQRGERRLNVAITRARRQMVIFSSFDPDELQAATAKGLVDLRDYLILAKRATEDRGGLDDLAPAKPDRYVVDVAHALRERGLEVKTGFGLSSFKVDLAVGLPDHAGGWLVGVLVDGRDWGRRDLALDRDALPTTVLRDLMGWPAIARVWLPAWRRDPAEIASEIHDLVLTVASGEVVEEPAEEPAEESAGEPAAQAAPEPVAAASAAPTERASAPAVVAGPAQPNGRRRDYTSFAFAYLLGVPEEIGTNLGGVRTWLRAIAEKEGPLPVDDALKHVARGYGLSKVHATRLNALRGAVPADLVAHTDFGDFLFPAALIGADGTIDPAFDWYRPTAYSVRSLERIAPQELANAAFDIATQSHGIEADELASELLSVFGYSRKTADAQAAARARVDWAISHGYLVWDGQVLRGPR